MANGVFFSNLVRLYHAVFDRESDLEGLGFWASNLAQGNITFADVADEFMASDEFIAKYVMHPMKILLTFFMKMFYTVRLMTVV